VRLFSHTYARTHTHTHKRFIIQSRTPPGKSVRCSAADSFHFIYISYTHARAYADQFMLLCMGLQICDLHCIRVEPPLPQKFCLQSFSALPSSTYLFTAGVEVVYFHLITLRHTPQSVGLLWTRDRPVPGTST
jgi:hypothetical protein